MLSARGGAFLSSDSLVFTSSGEPASALSILMQGSSLDTSGSIYGQGVLCVGGPLERLFTKTALGGQVSAPNFAAGDPGASVRAASRGDVIAPGQSRWYVVVYRDSVVLGACAPGAQFNSTQTGQIGWSP